MQNTALSDRLRRQMLWSAAPGGLALPAGRQGSQTTAALAAAAGNVEACQSKPAAPFPGQSPFAASAACRHPQPLSHSQLRQAALPMLPLAAASMATGSRPGYQRALLP